jgi:MarR family transcriptional regulator for hemolysin
MNDPEHSIGFLVNDVARLLRRNFNRRAESLGLSQAQSRVLAYLSRQDDLRQVTLAEMLEIQPMTLARQIDRLEELGLVARHPDPADRRAFRLKLTEKAKPHLDRMWALAAETRAEALDGLSDAEMRRVIETLRRMKTNLLEAETRAASGTTLDGPDEYAKRRA